MGAEIYALLYGFDKTIYIQNVLSDILGMAPQIYRLMDSKTLFNVVPRDGNTSEKGCKLTNGLSEGVFQKGN